MLGLGCPGPGPRQLGCRQSLPCHSGTVTLLGRGPPGRPIPGPATANSVRVRAESKFKSITSGYAAAATMADSVQVKLRARAAGAWHGLLHPLPSLPQRRLAEELKLETAAAGPGIGHERSGPAASRTVAVTRISQPPRAHPDPTRTMPFQIRFGVRRK